MRRLRDVLRRRPKVDWDPEPIEDVWSAVGEQPRGMGTQQRRGRIRGGYNGIQTHHQNRAGHRLYAKVFQNRQARLGIVGFGRWRHPQRMLDMRREGSWAAQTATPSYGTRAERRDEYLILYRQNRRNRLSRPPGRRQ